MHVCILIGACSPEKFEPIVDLPSEHLLQPCKEHSCDTIKDSTHKNNIMYSFLSIFPNNPSATNLIMSLEGHRMSALSHLLP